MRARPPTAIKERALNMNAGVTAEMNPARNAKRRTGNIRNTRGIGRMTTTSVGVLKMTRMNRTRRNPKGKGRSLTMETTTIVEK